MDASRTDPEFLQTIVQAAIEAGATTVNIPDTVGYAIPEEFGTLIRGIFENVPNIDKAVISVHCHNDLGLAVANSLAAVRQGARQVECTVNGIGERAGNASLEEIVMALRTRSDLFKLTTRIDTTQIYRASRLVSEHTGFMVQPNKAIVGPTPSRTSPASTRTASSSRRITYEIMDPQDVGIPASTLVLGKLTGRHAFRERLAELGYVLTEEDLNRAFLAFKELADKKKEVTDRDIEAWWRTRCARSPRPTTWTTSRCPAATTACPRPRCGSSARAARPLPTPPWAPARWTPSTRPSTASSACPTS